MISSLIKTMYRGLQKGTGLTEKQLLTPYYWLPYNLYKSGKAWTPLFVTLELTYRCNLRCKMCSLVMGDMVTRAGQRKNAELLDSSGHFLDEVTTDEYLVLIDQMADAGVKAVQLTGGEPLLRKDILTIAAAIKKRGMHLAIIHNGFAHPDLYPELVRLGLDLMTVSVDGTREIHDAIRGVPGSFDKAQSAIQALTRTRKSLGKDKPKVAVSCAVSALNQHDLGNLVQFFEGSEIEFLNFGYLHFTTAERSQRTEDKVAGTVMHLKNPRLPDPVLDVDTAALARWVAETKAGKDHRKLKVTFGPDLSGEEIHLQYTDDSFTFTNKCFYAWYATRVDPWGQMYPCWIDVRLGDVRDRSFADLWNGSGYRNFRRLIRKEKLLPKCTTCCVLSSKHWSRLPALRH